MPAQFFYGRVFYGRGPAFFLLFPDASYSFPFYSNRLNRRHILAPLAAYAGQMQNQELMVTQ